MCAWLTGQRCNGAKPRWFHGHPAGRVTPRMQPIKFCPPQLLKRRHYCHGPRRSMIQVFFWSVQCCMSLRESSSCFVGSRRLINQENQLACHQTSLLSTEYLRNAVLCIEVWMWRCVVSDCEDVKYSLLSSDVWRLLYTGLHPTLQAWIEVGSPCL